MIEVQKILAASERMNQALAVYSERELKAMADQAAADDSHKLSGQARETALLAVTQLQELLAQIQPAVPAKPPAEEIDEILSRKTK